MGSRGPALGVVEVAPGVRLRTVGWDPEVARGPDLLLVHGLASNARLYDGLAQVLADAGSRCVAVDQRGHGASDAPDDGYDVATLAADLAAVATATGLERPVAVGQSWGASVVLEFARRYPARVSGVVCIDGGTFHLAASFRDWESCWDALAPPHLAGTPIGTIEAWIRDEHPDWPETAIRGQLANFAVDADGYVRPHLERDHHRTILRRAWELDLPAQLRAVRSPVLLLPVDGPVGAWTDKHGAVAAAEALLPRVRTTWFDGHDHDVHAEAPEAVGAAILAAIGDGFLGDRAPLAGRSDP